MAREGARLGWDGLATGGVRLLLKKWGRVTALFSRDKLKASDTAAGRARKNRRQGGRAHKEPVSRAWQGGDHSLELP